MGKIRIIISPGATGLLVLSLLLLLLNHATAGTTSSTPRSSFGLRSKKLAVSAAVSAPLLFLGKKLLDGPVFRGSPHSMAGKDVLITGGNTGLGKESAIALAALGANVIILVRDEARGKAAVEDIKTASGSALVSLEVCDLADLRSVEGCAAALTGRLRKVDVMLNNAGVMAIPTRETTAQGFERQMGINHLGHFALTRLLLPLVEKSGTGRVVTVSSTAHLLGKLSDSRQDDLLLEKEGAYQPWPAYGNSKLANVLFAKELARRLQARASGVTSVVLHPGVCRTELGRYLFDPSRVPSFLYPVLGVVAAPAVYLTKSSVQGAQTQIYLAASPDISVRDSGKYYDNSKVADTSPESKDTQEAQWLWAESERLIGASFDV